MLPLGFVGETPLRRVLAIGAHSDDLEIGCAGTIVSLARANPGLAVDWVVLAASGDRADEARRSAEALLAGAAERSVEVLGFRDGYLPHTAADVKDTFEELKGRIQPDLVLTHTRDDLHQDHRLVCELTWNTFRDHVILEYEIPKWDGDTGRPNVYVALEESVVQEKLDLLGAHFDTQRGKDWYDVEVFRGLMRMRGMECRAPSGYAEAFVARKLRLAAGPEVGS
jgi:LmbE family N-acetylglucosaminyl deacetylase